jgi:hypothetical protein
VGLGVVGVKVEFYEVVSFAENEAVVLDFDSSAI